MKYYEGAAAKFNEILVERENSITPLVAFLAVLAILSGVAWLVTKESPFLFATLGISSCHLAGRKVWKFR
jgi:hypothetical protein